MSARQNKKKSSYYWHVTSSAPNDPSYLESWPMSRGLLVNCNDLLSFCVELLQRWNRPRRRTHLGAEQLQDGLGHNVRGGQLKVYSSRNNMNNSNNLYNNSVSKSCSSNNSSNGNNGNNYSNSDRTISSSSYNNNKGNVSSNDFQSHNNCSNWNSSML